MLVIINKQTAILITLLFVYTPPSSIKIFIVFRLFIPSFLPPFWHAKTNKSTEFRFSHCQIKGHGTQPSGIRLRLFGSKGVLETQYAGITLIRGDKMYRGDKAGALYKSGAATNIGTFHKSIVEGIFDNPTVEPSVESNLHSILVRQAAYGGETVRWEDLLKDTESIDPRIEGLVV